MKKLYISADIEGVCGIADWRETELDNPQGAYFRAEMTREVAAACKAAVSAGIGEVLVKDAHGSGRSIDPSVLPHEACIMRAWTKDPFVMMAGLDASFSGVAFIGYHSAAGTDGNPLAHTLETNNTAIIINGELASEFVINAYTAAFVGVPVLLLAGDGALCATAAALNPAIRTVAVSSGNGGASVSIHPDLAHERIARAMTEALSLPPDSFRIALPDRFKVTVRFKEHHLAHRGSFYPGAKKTGPHEVTYKATDWGAVLAFLFFVV